MESKLTTGEIIKIDPLKCGVGRQQPYNRVYFTLQDGSWAKTDIVSGFRNSARWKPLMNVGQWVCNLRVTGDQVDADSEVKAIGAQVRPPRASKPKPEKPIDRQLGLGL